MTGRSVFITGAGRGQGRSHALRLAAEGAALILCDLDEEGIESTAAEARSLGTEVVTGIADVTAPETLTAVLERGVGELGRLDGVIANAAVFTPGGPAWKITAESWAKCLEVNLTGVWNTIRATAPLMIEAGNGGSIVLIGSGSSAVGFRGSAHYNATKHGVIGLMRTLANELAPHMIRVNAVSPSTVYTPMTINPQFFAAISNKEDATLEDALPGFLAQNVLPIPWVEPEDISEAVLFLLADSGRFVTGVDLPVDAGTRIQPAGLPPSVISGTGPQTQQQEGE